MTNRQRHGKPCCPSGGDDMAYGMMTAAELLQLKAAIKAEMLRRNAPVGGLDA